MAYAFAKDIFVVGAKRTAFGTFGGSLKGHTANDLQVAFQIIFGFRNRYVKWTKMSLMPRAWTGQNKKEPPFFLKI